MKTTGFLVAAAIIGMGSLGGRASAQNQSAMAGHGWPNANDTCFRSSFAMVVNNCADGSHLLIVPVQAAAGNYQASARASGSPAYTVTSCQAMAINSSNSGWSFSSLRSTNVGMTPSTLTLGGINVPSQGTVHFECSLGAWISDLNGGGSGGRLINVELD